MQHFKLQARLTAASFATGTSNAASLSQWGFDTHGNNNDQYPALGNLLEGIHYLIEALTFFGIADQTVIMVASDIGRRALHNGSGGKDHHNVTGQMIIHPEGSGSGGKYFGETTDRYEQVKLNLETGKADRNGTNLTIRHTLYGMREYLGLNDSEQAKRFPLGENLIMPNLFS
nr:DUF1501 domain-containing protein [Marinibactrum halimedae]